MSPQNRRILKFVLVFLFVLFLIRLFPFALRAVNAAALGVRQFWWLVLILALGGWLFWVTRRRL